MDWEIFQDSLSNPQISKECRGWHGTIFTGRILWYKNKKADASLYGTLENRIDGVVITFSNITAAQQSLVDASTQSYSLSNARYVKGIDNSLSVLDAQRSLYAAQQGLVALRLTKFSNQARLYAVLGGGADNF